MTNPDASGTLAGDIMSREVVTCSELVDAIEAARTMTQKQVRRLLVNDDQGKVVGDPLLGGSRDQHQHDCGR